MRGRQLRDWATALVGIQAIVLAVFMLLWTTLIVSEASVEYSRHVARAAQEQQSALEHVAMRWLAWAREGRDVRTQPPTPPLRPPAAPSDLGACLRSTAQSRVPFLVVAAVAALGTVLLAADIACTPPSGVGRGRWIGIRMLSGVLLAIAVCVSSVWVWSVIAHARGE